MRHTTSDLAQMQSLPLEAKIRISKQRIEQWYDAWDGQVYVSFSGGKDSTVLLHLVRSIYPDVEAVFCDTGLEYPEIRDFVKTFENVTWLRPEMNFKEVIMEKGYPAISKEQSQYIREYKETKSEALKTIRWDGNKWGRGKISEMWKPIATAPFKISDKCCEIMKKKPSKIYEKASNKKPMFGTMAEESALRKSKWLQNGCNVFDSKRPESKPMSIWTENDVLEYISRYNIPYCSVYGDIVSTGGIIERGFEQIEKLKTTGLDRTGCMFCMFGLHLESEPNRFQHMKKTHPKTWEYCMKPVEDGGLGISEVIDYMNEHCNCHIKKE